MAEAWDKTKAYKAGEECSHNGVTYFARVPINNPLIEPHAGTDGVHWVRKGDKEVAQPEVLEEADEPKPVSPAVAKK